MLSRFILACTQIAVVLSVVTPSLCSAQTTVLSTAPPNVEYQYQLNYPRIWGWPGPGLSLGGSLPANGRQGISSFYGLPFPAPLGAGVYVNPFTYAARLPDGPLSFGLSASTALPKSSPSTTMPPIAQVPGTAPSNRFGVISPVSADASQRPFPISSVTSLERGRQVVFIGDEKLKNQQWVQAYINYRNAVMIADGLPEAHLRLGIASVALSRFPEAVQEFKRALFINPAIGSSGETLVGILGPESQPIRRAMTGSVAMWTKEDLRNQDRLFLLGAVLYFDDDRRAREILEAAYRLTGSGDHLLALLTPATPPTPIAPPSSKPTGNSFPPFPVPPEVPPLPELHQQPLALRQSTHFDN